ncbi:MAG: VgrG-related protein [Acidimicrobiales bacterium]
MPGQHQQVTNTLTVEVDGQPLADDVQRKLVTAYVDDNLHLPDVFVLSFRDPERTALDTARITIGSSVVLSVVSDTQPGPQKLMVGEVTAVEAEFGPGGSFTVVRGFDKAHRLFRGRVTESYRNVTYSDVVKKVAARAGLQTGRIEPTTTVHPHVGQGNQTDWELLSRLASEIGYEVAVADGKLDFRKPAESSAAPASGDLASEDPLQLTPGTNLLRFRSTVTSAQQVKEVKVRGWDVARKQAVIGQAPARTTSASLAVAPADLAAKFGNPGYLAVAPPLLGQAEVDALAKAMAEQIAGGFAEFEGVARGNPKLRAGTAVSLGLAGKPFDGRYTLTTTRHAYDPDEGYTTWFTASGRQERSLFGLTSGGAAHNGSAASLPGVMSALVTDVKDPDNLCRVKLKFPWLSENYETDWVRTVQPGAGGNRGSVTLPEVNDEVLVAFEQGDLRCPYVLGGVYNGVDKPKTGDGLIDSSTGAVRRRGFISKKGHGLVFVDGDGDEGMALLTGDRKLRFSLNQTTTTVKITSSGDVVIEAQGGVTIKGTNDLEVSANKLTLKANSGVTIDGGGGNVDVKGTGIDVKGTGRVALKGANVSVNGDANAEVKGGAMVTVQGAIVKIN